MPYFSFNSASRLATCDKRLQDILNEVIKYYDCTIIFGHRSKADQDKAYSEGRSKKKWPNSKHNTYPSTAVDVAPWPIPKEWGKDWKERVKFYELKGIIFYEAAKKGIKLRFGGDWDMDNDYTDQTFDDLVHFEILE
jgi:peptidoglycan L-alanyl-D-glutamate endopeptidase CwlK